VKITDVQLNENLTKSIGLSPIKMSKIGNIVLLAGKNGSGKTRLLKLVSQLSANLHTLQQNKLQAPTNIQNYRAAITRYTSQIDSLKAQVPQSIPQIEQAQQNIVAHENAIREQQDILDNPIPIFTDSGLQNIAVVDFVPNNIELNDWSNINKQEWMKRANQAKQIGVANLHQATIPLIQQISERWVNTTHPKLEYSEKEIRESTDDYQRLQSIIKSFLGTEIGWNKDGYSTIFDKPIAQANLSAGQKVLLQLCVAIFAQGGSLSNHIIFMDEPENHLHPSAVVDLLDTIKEHNPDGQIWIATHSIPLLSHFDASSLWFVEDGTVKHSGKKPELVLSSLLGNDERIRKLRDFTGLPDELARNRFAFECLCPPQVVETDSKDPQSIQLKEQLKVIWEDKESINFLDFGAGKGRMIANLADYEGVSPTTLNYHAFDPSDSEKELCLKNISLSYPDAEQRYHNSIEAIRTKLDDHYFDVIVLSNVLHEIPHSDWCEIFRVIKILLKEDGYLLLIEDCRIPTGELPHNNGFVVFSTLHLKKLLSIPATEQKFIMHDARFDSAEQRGRLMAHLIPCKYLGNITPTTIIEALSELKNSSKAEIRKIRATDATYSNGLAHGFWIQQLANATLCLAELGVE